jgi:hypothetical protein
VDRPDTEPPAVDTDGLLEELQRAADEHRLILERQQELITRLRAELKGVTR